MEPRTHGERLTPDLVFTAFTAGGIQLMGWLTGSEIYPLANRAAGAAAQSASLWGTNLLITLTLLSSINTIGRGRTIWLYAAFNNIAFVFLWRRMPELTGRSLEQIEGNLRRGGFTPTDFARQPAAAGAVSSRASQ